MKNQKTIFKTFELLFILYNNHAFCFDAILILNLMSWSQKSVDV